ncbi:MAG: proline dehydrogenase [Frankiales bacterium]|nr:proline dehydrogenase [Frankiales bacterium]
MSVLRAPLLALARSARVRRRAEHSRLTQSVVRRYVAGPTEADALRVTHELLSAGLQVTLDFLGEDVTAAEQIDRTVAAYRSALSALAGQGRGPRAEVSVKLSALGQSLPVDGEKLALEAARAICESAAAAGTTVTIDMEDHTTTDSTLGLVRDLRVDFPWVGVVLQAYLKRTEGDCRDLARVGSRVRLCKGAYAEPESVAYRGEEVSQSYRRCLDVLLAGPGFPMIATHDPAMIAAAQSAVARFARAGDTLEFQMLYGVRPDEQSALAARGHAVRVYLPYGEEWYGYFMRRLAERPANLALFLRSLTSRK